MKVLGRTIDSTKKEVEVRTDGEKLFIVHHVGKENERISSALISDVESNPDRYMFTPYVEFI